MSAFAIHPVQGHFTLGDLTGTYRYHALDFDHVAGVVGYVWPGSGLNAYEGSPDAASSSLSPGYQSPYPGGNPPGAPSEWYQLEGNSYAPFGAVLTGSTGDLIFAITATTGYRTDGTGTSGPKGTDPTRGWTGLMIAIPPGFNVHDSSQVVSSFTNDYSGIYVTKVGPYDRYIPGWTLVTVLAENGRDTVGSSVYYDRQTIQFTSKSEWYYVRINGVTAPTVAGRYFFKILLWGDSGYLAGPEGTAFPTCAIYSKGSACFPNPAPGEAPTQFLPTENWPVTLVKGELDPAIITGVIRYGGYNATLNGQPVQEAGMVYAKMRIRLDPYTGQQRSDLPTVDAVGYFNSTAKGHYEVEGLAPGIYDLYASAAGYPQTLIQSSATVLKGQSLHFDGYLQPGPVIHGNVYTKHQFGDQPWPESTYVKIELYDGPTANHKPDPNAHLISWSPSPCVAGGQEFFYGFVHAGQCGDPRLASNIAFPWHEYNPANGYGFPTSGTGASYYQVSVGTDPLMGPFVPVQNLDLQDPMGVGPPQHWYVQGGTANPFHFEFGAKGEYGAPKDLSGMVPQVYATWVNGLTSGRYYARAWVFRYVQSALDGFTFQEYYFDVTPKEWAGDVSLPIDLRLSSWVNKTVHFHNTINGMTEDPIDTGAGLMSGVLVDGSGQVWSYNQTLLGYHGNYPSQGAYSGGFNVPTTSQDIWGVDLDEAKLNAHAIETGRADIQFWGINDTWGGENYGIPAGTYSSQVYVLGYLEQNPQAPVSVTLSGNSISISDHMIRGAGFNVTVYSTDWEQPRVSRPWVWGNPTGFDFQGHPVGQEIDVGFYRNGTLVDFLGDSVSSIAAANQLQTSCLYQGGDAGALCPGVTANAVQAVGGGWNPLDSTGKVYPGANGVFFGQELRAAGAVGGYTTGLFLFETATTLFAPFTNTIMIYPTAFDSGQYDLRAFTYGYIQDNSFSAYAQRSQIANLRINLVVGVNVTLDILFKKEHIITPTAANMSARLRLFDDSGNLVAEWMSSEGMYLVGTGFARAADGTNQYPFGPVTTNGAGRALQPQPNPLKTYNFLPGGVTSLHVLMAGLPQVPPFGQNAFYGVPKGGYNGYGTPPGWGGPYFGDPVFTHQTKYLNGWPRSDACDFELDCYVNPGSNWNATGFFPNSGISGAPNYQGGWTAEVDFVNWYSANSGTTPNYYLPVSGLLMGESYHLIPGSTATSGVSLTEDAALSSAYVGHSMAENHLGPYSQQGVWQILGAHNSGGASAAFEVDLNGLVSGNALAFTWNDEFRPLSWDTVTVTGADGASWNLSVYDSFFEAYLTPGTYKFTLSAPGFVPQSWPGTVTAGMNQQGQSISLEQSKIPVPEFNGVAIIAFSALAASLYLLRRKRSLASHT